MANNDLLMQWKDITREILVDNRIAIEDALNEASDILVNELKQNSPVSSNPEQHLRDSWKVKREYKGVRYIGATKAVSDGRSDRIPLSNILEYAEDSPYKGFIQRTYISVKDNLYQKMLEHLSKKLFTKL